MHYKFSASPGVPSLPIHPSPAAARGVFFNTTRRRTAGPQVYTQDLLSGISYVYCLKRSNYPVKNVGRSYTRRSI